MSVARPKLLTPLPRRRALPGGAGGQLGLAPAGDPMFPPRAPFVQRPMLSGKREVPLGPLPAHAPKVGP